MLKHEEAARAVHPEASKFHPVQRFGKIIGWTFHVSRRGENDSREGFSWVNLEDEVPGDVYGIRREASTFLRVYRKAKAQRPVNTLEKRA